MVKKRKLSKLLGIVNSKPFMAIATFIFLSLVMVLASDVIVKEGAIDIGSLIIDTNTSNSAKLKIEEESIGGVIFPVLTPTDDTGNSFGIFKGGLVLYPTSSVQNSQVYFYTANDNAILTYYNSSDEIVILDGNLKISKPDSTATNQERLILTGRQDLSFPYTSHRGGFIEWKHGNGTSGGGDSTKGYIFVNNNGQLVFSNQTQSSATDTGKAYINFTSGEAGFLDNIRINTDNKKILFGAKQNASIYWDGANLIINTSEKGGPGIAWFSNNISATGYITRTIAWDKTKQGSALNYIREDYISTNGEVNHSKYSPIEKATYQVVDYNNCWTEQEYEQIENETRLVRNLVICATKEEQGTRIDASVAKHEQAIYELLQQINALKSESCSRDNTYSWC